MTQRMLPLYESKMLHQYDHRWATFDSGVWRELTDAEKTQSRVTTTPRYWIRDVVVDDRLESRSYDEWLMGWRKLARATDVRTLIDYIFPRGGLGDSGNLVIGAGPTGSSLYACLASFAMDYVARQKLGGSNFNFFQLAQLPVLPPSAFQERTQWERRALSEWLDARVIELIYTADDVRAFAEDLGDSGEPFVWDPERRFLLRCELDAAFFHLYGVARDDVDYIMETFPIVKGKDLAAHGEFRTKRVILGVFDAMQLAIETGESYRTILDPPPGEGSRHPKEADR